MSAQHIPRLIALIDKIVSPDHRMRKYSDRQIVKILILLQIFHISYRSQGNTQFPDIITKGKNA